MNKSLLSLLAGALVTLMILTGCGGGGGGSSSGDNGGGNGAGGTKLSLFTDQVKSCTPYISIGSLSNATSSLLDDWNSWSTGVSGSVLGKLFDPANGKDECIYSPVQVLDSHINLVNQFSDRWLTSGTYTQGSMTAVVDTTFSAVTPPFINQQVPEPMDRLVTLTVPDQNLTIYIAFSQSNGNQIIVEQYTIGNSESGAYVARVVGDDVEVWFAGITGSKVQMMWEGNTAEKTFTMTECTNASGGNWEVMGGGSVAGPTSKMAFMARNNQNNNSSDSDTYYITTTLNDLENGTLQPIFNADATPPNPDTESVQAYVTPGESECLGFFDIGYYPNTLEDLAWVQF
jgi:hypothetical protein